MRRFAKAGCRIGRKIRPLAWRDRTGHLTQSHRDRAVDGRLPQDVLRRIHGRIFVQARSSGAPIRIRANMPPEALIAVLSIDRQTRTPARIIATTGERPVPLIRIARPIVRPPPT
jgi:hypothetical protein